MENNFYRDQFEQLLKNTADEFRMYPNRKVWHGIYNSMHPGKKWPSFAVLLLLMVSIKFIDITNPSITLTGSENMVALASPAVIHKELLLGQTATGTQEAVITTNRPNPVLANNTYKAIINQADYSGTYNKPREKVQQYINQSTAQFTGNNEMPVEQPVLEMIPVSELNEQSSVFAALQEVTEPEMAKETAINTISNDDREWMENYALVNLMPGNKQNKWAFQFYATPSIGYRSLEKDDEIPSANRSAIISNASEDEYFLNHSSALNLEAGGNLLYDVSVNLRLKAGIQFNYTNYNISAYELHHPVTSNLLMRRYTDGSPILVSVPSMISNSQSLANTNFNNNTYQFSLPIGADYRILGKNKIHWYAGATFQPTYTAGGNALLISADMKNYIADETVIRKFNLNGGLETFVSYRLNQGVTFNAGPQVRYQFLSTYNNQYTYKENLFNFGIKFGITSKF